MATLYIRNVDAKTHAVLEKIAEEKQISVSELIRRVLFNYASTEDLQNIDNKYRAFTQEILELYHYDHAQLEKLAEQNQELIHQNEELYQRVLLLLERNDD